MASEQFEFSHYERCFDAHGWMYIRAWYWDNLNNKLVSVVED